MIWQKKPVAIMNICKSLLKKIVRTHYEIFINFSIYIWILKTFISSEICLNLENNSGDRSFASQYQPISIFGVFRTVFVSINNKKFDAHANMNNRLTEKSYGFHWHMSTIDDLPFITHKIINVLSK